VARHSFEARPRQPSARLHSLNAGHEAPFDRQDPRIPKDENFAQRRNRRVRRLWSQDGCYRPAKVTRLALQNAASSRLDAHHEALIADIKETTRRQPLPEPPRSGMGGMY